MRVLSVAAALLLTPGLAPLAQAQLQPAGPPARVLVMPFENVTREGRIFWLGEASAVLLTDDLNALGISAISREERREAFDRLQVPPAVVLTDATVIRLGQLVGASEVVVGSLELVGESLIVKARTIALDAARVRHNGIERGPLAELYPTFERMARQLAPGSARSSDEVERQHPPLAVFENYIKGLLADSPKTAITYLTAALRARPGFDRARLAIWDVYSQQGDHQRAADAVARVAPDSPLADRARFLLGLSQLRLGRNDDAYDTYTALAEVHSTPAVFNNLGVIQLRRGGGPQTGQPTVYFNRAADADPTEPDYFFNLGYAYWTLRDTGAAIYWLREAVRRNPADGEAHYVLGAILAAAGTQAEGNREKELARRLSSTFVEWDKRPAADSVPRGLERIKDDIGLPHAPLEESLAGQRDQDHLATFYVERGRRMFEQENDRGALTELNRALFLSPYQAEAHLLVGRIHLRGGRAQEAIDSLKISLWSAESAAAHAALAAAYVQTKDNTAAESEATRALVLDPASEEAKRVLDGLARVRR
jgi:tetratricopeptide (TPR) repeat protein